MFGWFKGRKKHTDRDSFFKIENGVSRKKQELALENALSKAMPDYQKAKILELFAKTKSLDDHNPLTGILRNVTFNLTQMAKKDNLFAKHPIAMTILLEEAARYDEDIFMGILEIGSLDLFQNSEEVVEALEQYVEDGEHGSASDVVDSVVDGIYNSWVNMMVLWLVDRFVENSKQ